MGRINIDIMLRFMNLEGDVVELGVNQGSSSKKMVEVVKRFQKSVWFFDSFRGMPASNDPVDKKQYPKGRFRNASADKIVSLIGNYPRAYIVAGWLPETLEAFSLKICFAYLDLDHYQSTKRVLPMLWDRMIPGGGILCDDYFEEKNQLATKAIKEFIAKGGIQWEEDNGQVLLKRGEER